MGVLASLLAARARRAGVRRLAVAAALGLATALAVVSAAITAVTAESTLTTAVGALPPGERSVVVASYGLPTPQRVDELDALVRSRLPRLGAGPVRRVLVHREVSDSHRNVVVVAATDDLAGAVRLVSGRLPSSCTPARCEVVFLQPDSLAPGAAAPRPPAIDSTLGLVVVGTVRRVDPLLLSGTFTPATTSPVLLGDGVRRVAALAVLQPFARTFGWVAPLDLARVKGLGVETWADTATAIADDFGRRAPAELILTAPTDLLRQQHERALTSTQRFGLLGATGSVLLLGAAVVGGAALRRDHEAFTGALRRRGAAPRLLQGLLAGEVLGAAVAGLVVGCVLGAVGAVVVALRGGLPVLGTTGAAVLAALPGAAVLTLLAAVLLAVTVALPAARDGAAARSVWHVVEAAAFVCVAVAVVLAARGGVTPGGSGDGAGGGTSDPLLLTLPVLVLAAASLALARLWLPVVRLGEHLVPRRSVAARLGLAAVTGRPLRPAATAALLTAAVATSVFAGAYRTTLDRGATDQAAFEVPLDARVQVGPSLVRPYDAVAPSRLATALPGVTARPVLRITASRRVTSDQGAGVQLVGLPPETLPEMTAWADTTGGPDPAGVARALRVGALPQGTPLPAGRTLRIATPGPAVTVAVTATLRAADGREQNVELRVARATHGTPAGLEGDLSTLNRAGVPPTDPHLVALTLRLPADEETRRVHGIGEDITDRILPTGRLALGTVTVDGKAVPSPWRGWTGTRAAPAAAGSSFAVDYRLTTGAAVLTGRSGGPGDAANPVPVAVDPATAAAAHDGLIDLALSGTNITARVVAVLPRFPTVTTGSFAVIDLGALARLIDVSTPGVAEPIELWLAGPGLGRLADPPFNQLGVQMRASLEASLRADPVARGAADLLAWAAAATLLAGAAALILLVAAERYDDAAAEYAWEADGVPPSTLRAALWWRALAVAVPAVPAGILGGVVLATLTARLVAVTATATAARPPLVAGAGLLPGSLLALAVLAAALAAAAVLAASSLREPLPRRRIGVAG